MSRKTIVFDFDGVIHKYSKGWQDGSIYDEPVKGIKELIEDLRTEYKVVVVSTRCLNETGTTAVWKWLEKYGIVVDDCTGVKVPASMYIDDRAIKFDGNVDHLRDAVDTFSTWQENKKLNRLFSIKGN